MNIGTWMVILAAAARAGSAEPADTNRAPPAEGLRTEQRKDIDWSFAPDPSRPNVLILGDSISIGYTLPVRKLLEGKANVFRPVTSDGTRPVNCSGTTVGVERIDEWLGERAWDVIHFNWGLHDLKHVGPPAEDGRTQNVSGPDDPPQATVEAYSENLTVIVEKLKATGARLIFATTTPVTPGTTKPFRRPEAPAEYNAAALTIMNARSIAVNDLYSFCLPRLDELQLPVNVHFTPHGSDVLAGRVAAAIEKELTAMPPRGTAP